MKNHSKIKNRVGQLRKMIYYKKLSGNLRILINLANNKFKKLNGAMSLSNYFNKATTDL